MKFLSGGTPTMSEAKYWNGDIPWVSSGEMNQRKIHDTSHRVTEDGAKEGSKRVPARTVLAVVRGMSLAKEFRVAITARDVTFNQDLKALMPSKLLVPEFLFYYLLSQNQPIRDSASESAHGTKKIDTQVLEVWPLPLPAVLTQKKIAAVLSTYDEMIENNQRRIALLEKLAEELYREWFVRLRFPGHEKVKLVKGVPEGWDLRRFSDIVEINPTERIDKEEERPFVAMEELSVSSMYFTHRENRKGHVGPKFRNGDVLFPRITPSVENGKRGLVMTLAEGEVAQGSTEFIVLREKVLTAEHIYFLSVSEGFRTNAELSMTGASGRQRVQEQCFAQFLVKTPPPALREKFTSIVRPMVSQIHILSTQTEVLQRTRDLLLPRLISGKLSVEHLDIQFPPGMKSEPSINPSHEQP
ncbi:MAG: restriction endonuclease subunit S [Verrucomicrobiales bacterium]|nr:restriction endonuclease subunit S [Verrucomicrobiales bacterium]